MLDDQKVTVMIPALDEADSIGAVVSALPRDLIDEVVVVDNGSRDATAIEARRAGAVVLYEQQRGYGWALLRAMRHHGTEGIVVFMDGDGADDPDDLTELLEPFRHGADLVIGARVDALEEDGATTWPQRLGNRLVVTLIERLVGHRFHDLGPFRAIRAQALRQLEMCHATYGWTAEMQIKAVTRDLELVEVPVHHRRRRAGQSKVSGNLRAVFKAGLVMPTTVIRLAVSERLHQARTRRRRHN